MRNRSNILVGAPEIKAAGGFRIGVANPAISAYPTSAVDEPSTALNLAAAGFISEDGVTKTVDRSTDKIKDWNGDTMIIVQSDHSVSLQTTFCEAANADVLKFLFGEANVQVTESGIVVADTADELPNRSILVDIRGSQTSKIRLFAPDVQVTEVGEVQFVRSGLIQYQATMECFANAENKKLIQFIERNYEGSPVIDG